MHNQNEELVISSEIIGDEPLFDPTKTCRQKNGLRAVFITESNSRLNFLLFAVELPSEEYGLPMWEIRPFSMDGKYKANETELDLVNVPEAEEVPEDIMAKIKETYISFIALHATKILHLEKAFGSLNVDLPMLQRDIISNREAIAAFRERLSAFEDLTDNHQNGLKPRIEVLHAKIAGIENKARLTEECIAVLGEQTDRSFQALSNEHDDRLRALENLKIEDQLDILRNLLGVSREEVCRLANRTNHLENNTFFMCDDEASELYERIKTMEQQIAAVEILKIEERFNAGLQISKECEEEHRVNDGILKDLQAQINAIANRLNKHINENNNQLLSTDCQPEIDCEGCKLSIPLGDNGKYHLVFTTGVFPCTKHAVNAENNENSLKTEVKQEKPTLKVGKSYFNFVGQRRTIKRQQQNPFFREYKPCFQDSYGSYYSSEGICFDGHHLDLSTEHD